MTPDDISLMETFQAFCEQAHTRGDAPFKFEYFSVSNTEEGGIKAVGKVYLKTKNDYEIPLGMEWSLSGDALKVGGQFDLIVEEPFEL